MKKFAMPISVGAFVLGGILYVVPSLFFNDPLGADISLKPLDQDLVDLGKLVYENNCASCHGVNLEGQERWRQPDADGYMPAPPHDESGHTWHHPDALLFKLTKYGFAAMISSDYKVSMPIYDDVLKDEEIVATLSYIESTWPDDVKQIQDKINADYNLNNF